MTEMKEIIIGYEDRLRLSELAGQMAKAQWTADNAVMCTMPFTIVIVAFTLFTFFFLLSDYFDGRNKKIIVAVLITVIVAELILIPFIVMIFAERDIIVIQTQIDEIYRMWGMS